MAQDFFRIYRGLELDDSVQFLTGTGAPGAAGDTAAAPVGSYFTDQTSGDFYTKIAAGTGLDKWSQVASQQFVQEYLTTGISWREPAKVADTTTTTLPVGTPSNTIVVDGVVISGGDRVLFAGISGGNGPNVYIYDQAAGVFVEDANTETDGDTVFIQEGTAADSTYQYNGSMWFTITTSTATAELAYIRDFIGKPTAGSVLPDYTSTNIVADNDTSTAAISKLDAEAGYVNAFTGKTAGNDTTDYSSNEFVNDGDSLEAAIGKLDAAVASTSLTNVVNNVTTLTNVASAVAVVAEWDVFIRDVATPTRIWAGKVFATHNGVSADHTKFGVLKVGAGNITGLDVSVALSGVDTLNLTVASTSAVDVKAQRLSAIV